MKYLQYTNFRNHSKEYFKKVSDGESFVIIKRGQPIARLIPFEVKEQGWKRKINKINLKDESPDSTTLIRKMRDEE